jgi:hypothetical protein
MKKLFLPLLVFQILYGTMHCVAQQPADSKVFSSSSTNLQIWEAAKTFDHKYVLAGRNDQTAMAVKLDSTGSVIWARTIGPQNSCFNSVISTADSCVVLAGTFPNPNGTIKDFYCVKLNSSGDTLWSRMVETGGTDVCYSLKQTVDGCFLLAGTNSSNIAMVVKLNPNGHLLWGKRYPGGTEEFLTNIEVLTDTGFIAIGSRWDNVDGVNQMILMRCKSNGDVVWAQRDTPPLEESSFGESVKVVSDGILTAFSETTEGLVCLKTDFSGNKLWCKSYQDYPNRAFGSLIKLKTVGSGDLVFSFGNNFMGGSLIKLDPSGNLIWSNGFNITTIDLEETNDGRYMIFGNGPMNYKNQSATTKQNFGIIWTDLAGQTTACTDLAVADVNDYPYTLSTLYLNTDNTGTEVHFAAPVISISFTSRDTCVGIISGIPYEIKKESEVTVYPNPSSGLVHIKLDQAVSATFTRIEVYNSMGQQVFEIIKPDLPEPSVNLSNAPQGIYQLKVTIGDTLYYSKFVICR